jgi:hypothetical protein
MSIETTMKNAPREWKNMEDFSAGIDGNRLPATTDLAGKKIEFVSESESLVIDVEAEQLAWSFKGRTGTAPYEAIQVAENTYYIDFVIDSAQGKTLTLFVNVRTFRAVVCHVYMILNPQPGETMVRHEWHVGVIKGGQPAGAVPGPSRDLIGQHAVYRYSPNHLYEHFYINSERFLWHCLHGEQKGHAAAEYATIYKFSEECYLLAWRELLIPTGTVFFLNFRENRSTGKFVGMHKDGTIANDPGGAIIQKICTVHYPNPFKAV